VPLLAGTLEIGDEPAQLHRITDTFEAHLQRAQEETSQATQALAQAHEYLLEQCSTTEQDNLTLEERFDEEKSQLHKEKEQLLVEKIEVKEMVHKELISVIVIEVKAEERVP
jgi:hypothetical protein